MYPSTLRKNGRFSSTIAGSSAISVSLDTQFRILSPRRVTGHHRERVFLPPPASRVGTTFLGWQTWTARTSRCAIRPFSDLSAERAQDTAAAGCSRGTGPEVLARAVPAGTRSRAFRPADAAWHDLSPAQMRQHLKQVLDDYLTALSCTDSLEDAAPGAGTRHARTRSTLLTF